MQPPDPHAAECTAAIDTSGYVRRARRLADLSQRDLAAHIGVAQSRISMIEAGRSVDVATFARILAAAALHIAVVDAQGSEIAPMPDDVMRDAAQRRQPAHLDVHTAPEHPTPEMVARHREPDPRLSWHHRRPERDRRRTASGRDATADQPTARSLAAWHHERNTRRGPRAWAAIAAGLDPSSYPDDIHIDPSERARSD